MDTTLSITQLLRNEGLYFIDKRGNGGALWVVGGSELNSTLKEIEQLGYKFNFAPNGGRVTKNQSAWYHK